jgi:hypothetical protein
VATGPERLRRARSRVSVWPQDRYPSGLLEVGSLCGDRTVDKRKKTTTAQIHDRVMYRTTPPTLSVRVTPRQCVHSTPAQYKSRVLTLCTPLTLSVSTPPTLSVRMSLWYDPLWCDNIIYLYQNEVLNIR